MERDELMVNVRREKGVRNGIVLERPTLLQSLLSPLVATYGFVPVLNAVQQLVPDVQLNYKGTKGEFNEA